VLARTPTVAQRLFTDGERAYASSRGDPVERLAARFAAKEAVMKALGLGVGAFAFREVEVVSRPGSGAAARAPDLRLHGEAAAAAGRRRVGGWHVSLTHTAHLAIAMVVASGACGPSEVGGAPPS
jgi:holo-[acyl-carrier protein] synthase